MIIVKFTENEIRVAAIVGVERFLRPIFQGQKNRYGAKDDWTNDINSAIAECAVAKVLNQYWHASPAMDSQTITNDVGNSWQVRTSRSNKLIVRKGDKDDQFYILVTWPKFDETGCTVHIVGGMKASDAKQTQYVENFGNNRPPCFAVPQSELIPAEELFRWP